MHEKGKSPMNGSGPGAVSSEGGQGLNQSGGSAVEPSLEQNQTNFSRTGYRTGQKQAPEQDQKQVSEQAWKQASEQALNMFYQVLRGVSYSVPNRGPARIGPDRVTSIPSLIQEFFLFGLRFGPGLD